ncbi:MAG: DUF3859 domain-containing protein [Nitrospirae bacterium]|nr:DUF3859 domain-containing protein [Nitrospirota bacterium]
MSRLVRHHYLMLAGPILSWITLFLLACPSTGFTRSFTDDSVVIHGVEIIEYGLYEADRLGRINEENTSLGSITVLNEETVRLAERTTRIRAEVGKKFGIRYIFHGVPNKAYIEHTIRVITPGLNKPSDPGPSSNLPQNGRAPNRQSAAMSQTTEQWTSHATLEQPAYDFFGFEYEWELVPGTWTFQIWYKNRMLAEQSFEVYPAAAKGLALGVSQPVKKVLEYMTSSECINCLRAVYMVKVLGKEASPALPYLINALSSYSKDNQTAFDCGCAKEAPAAIAAIGGAAVAPLIDNLASNLWTVREGATKALLLLGETAIEPLITTARSGRNLDTRRCALQLLGEFKEDRRIVPPLIELLKTDYFPEIRYAALEALQQFKDPSVMIAAEEVVNNGKDAGIRSKAAELLGGFREQRAVERLIETYQKKVEDYQVREAALKSLVHNHDPLKVAPFVNELLRERDPLKRVTLLQTISASDDMNYATILGRHLVDPDIRVREVAVEGLIKIKTSGDILRPALSSADHKVRIPALFELARRGEPAALNILPELLRDSNSRNRLEAAMILAQKKDNRAFEPLMEIARFKDSEAAATAIRGLGILGDKRALDLIRQAANQENLRIVQAALEALGMMSYPEAITYLIDYIAADHIPSLDYTYAARDSLIKLGEQSVIALISSLRTAGGRRLLRIRNEFKYVVKAVGRASFPHLANAIKSPIIEVKKNTAEALSLFRESDAASILVTALFDREIRHDIERYLRYIGQPSVKSLLHLTDEKNEDVRFSALTILGALGEKNALKPLIKALDNDKQRISAIEALGGIKEPKAVKALLPFLKDENANFRMQAVSSLGLIGDKIAIAPLVDMLGSENDHNAQAHIIEALGNLHARTASQNIIVFLKNENGQMRITAARSLLNIAAPDSAAALVEALDDQESIARDYAYSALKKITQADCGIYPDAWRLWLERNAIPEPAETQQDEMGILEYIAQFWAKLLKQLLARIIHLFPW